MPLTISKVIKEKHRQSVRRRHRLADCEHHNNNNNNNKTTYQPTTRLCDKQSVQRQVNQRKRYQSNQQLSKGNSFKMISSLGETFTTTNILFLLILLTAKSLTSSSLTFSNENRPQAVANDDSSALTAEFGAENRPEISNTNLEASTLDGATQQTLVNRNRANVKLHIVRLIAPEAVQNGTQNVTIDCMFKFDRKLDQRLTIKWFFNDELEPIYQWIPELNKRVYSDRYERFLDKSYQVSEDADFMLQAYKWLLAAEDSSAAATAATLPAHLHRSSAGAPEESQAEESAEQLNSSRRLLANRLNKLAKLGGRHSSQLLESLRVALAMDQADFSRFRALRLIRPTSELSGRFTCSVSSLDGDDLRSSNLLVYEPAKNFTFEVSRLSSQLYNLTCRASHLFPRPSLALFRYRAGPLDSLPAPQPHQVQVSSQQHTHRPRLAATTLRQEPLANTHTQLTVISANAFQRPPSEFVRAPGELPGFNDINDNHLTPPETTGNASPVDEEAVTVASSPQPPVYEISAWTLVDEASLSSNVVSQFECHLSIEGTGYEQRQSLALQRGWHVNSAGVAMRSTLVGLFSALASLLCLMLALVSSMLIFRLLKRHASKRRVHQAKQNGDNRHLAMATSDSEHTNSTGTLNVASIATNLQKSLPISQDRPTATLTDSLAAQQQQSLPDAARADQQLSRASITSDSDGIYRVPEQQQQQHQVAASFGTRFVIGPGARNQFYGNLSAQQASSFNARVQHPNSQQQKQQQTTTNTFGSGKPLYC